MAESDKDIEYFERCKVDVLKEYCKRRGHSVTGKRKKELVALAWALSFQKAPIVLTKQQEREAVNLDYISLLEIDVDSCQMTIPDPLQLREGWENESTAANKWPPCMYIDINNYLTRKDELNLLTKLANDYKEGKAFSYFASQNAWVKEVFYHEVSKDSKICFLKCDCTPSQRFNNVPHKLWVCFGKASGTIYSAYCTCFAGLGSTCNHVAALLFKVDYAWQHGLTSAHKKACTSMENQWLTPVLKSIEPMKLEDMVFAKPHYTPKRRDVKQGYAVRKLFSVNRSTRQEPAMSLDEFAAVLMPECPSAVAFQYALPDAQPTYEVYDDINVCLSEMCITSVNPPPTLTKVAEKYTTAEELWSNLPQYSTEEVSSLEAATREQAVSALWKQHRNGRITASKAHHVWKRMKTQDAEKGCHSLVSSITGKAFVNPNIPALKYGRVNEPFAVTAYMSSQKASHSNLKVTQCGLFVMQDHVFAAASPDRLVSCSCCGEGLLEVKCPFSAADQPANVKHVTYLEIVNGKTHLKHMHEYYSQVQYQMGVTKRLWCDFFVYTKSDCFVERILFDETHWLELLTSATDFFKTYICDALVNKVE
ncbi:unnamed protein product [Knipowitschia caucasica]